MPIRRLAYLAAVCALLVNPTLGAAQDQPLSVIDWLARNPDTPAMTSAILPKRFEPPVAPNALPPKVAVQPLDATAARLIGLVPSAVTGLPDGLWSGSTIRALDRQFATLPTLNLPAAQALLNTLLLTEATGPTGDASGQYVLARIRAQTLFRVGAPDAAQALLEQSGATQDKATLALYMDAALLTEQEDAACAVLALHPNLTPSLAHSIFCAARQGDWPTAALLFDTGSMLAELSPAETRALERFLHPDASEDLPPLLRPSNITPLLFRVHEAIGEPLPTRGLPRAYSVADLRDIAGWKAQLEAAERLTSIGALPANRLLGLYTSRRAAASGGVWDRVRTMQQFETALRTRSGEAIGKTLPLAWAQMQNAGLEMAFSELFAESLQRYELPERAEEIAQAMILLSPSYRAARFNADTSQLYNAIATGTFSATRPSDPRGSAIAAGFDKGNARPDLTQMAQSGRMGEAILRSLLLLESGAAGELAALTQALATLRSFGLEDTVRRAALQFLLLERYSL